MCGFGVYLMKRTFFISILAIIVSGCTTVQNAMNPYSLMPKNYNEFSDQSLNEKKITRLDYAPSTIDESLVYSLAELLDIALLNNPETKIKWEDARIAASEYGQTLQNYFPQLNGDLVWTREKNPNFSGTVFPTSWVTSYQAIGSLSYLIFDFGQLRATSNSALFAFQSADFNHNRQLQTTIQTVMNDYYDYLFQTELLESKKEDMDDARISLDAATERLKTGMTDASDYIQAKTAWLKTKLDVTNQNQNVHNSLTKLTDDLGVAPPQKLQTQKFPKEIQKVKLQTSQELIKEAKALRPDYKGALATVLSNEEAVNAAFRQNYPSVNGSFFAGRSYVTGGMDSYITTITGGVEINIPIFQGFYIQNQVKQAKSTLKKSEFQMQQLVNAIEKEISNAREDILLAIDSYDDAKEFLQAAEKDFTIQISKYKAGTNTIIDVINAQTSVANARAQFIQTKKSYYTSLANLAYATGGIYASPPTKQGES